MIMCALFDSGIVGVGTDCTLYIRETLSSAWLHVLYSGDVLTVTKYQGKLIGLGRDSRLWWRRDLYDKWRLIEGGREMACIATLNDDEGLVGVGYDRGLWHRGSLA